MSMLEYSFPGILGIGIMMTAIMPTVGVNAKNRARGIFRKLATTPISRIEWNASPRSRSQAIITLMSVTLSLAAAWLLFGLFPHIDVATLLLLIAGTMAFVGLGLILSILVKERGHSDQRCQHRDLPAYVPVRVILPGRPHALVLQGRSPISRR